MGKPKKLYRTTIVIWSDDDPSDQEIDDLAREATEGGAFCSSNKTDVVVDPSQFPETEFFDSPDDEDEENDDEAE